MNVRPLEQSELKQLIPLYKANPLPYHDTVNPEFLIASWENLLSFGTGRAYGLFRESGELVGFLFALITPDLLSGNLQGMEYLWYVIPSVRRSGASLKLMQKFEEDCKDAGCKTVAFGCMKFHEPEKLHGMYKRLGYSPASMSFIKVL